MKNCYIYARTATRCQTANNSPIDYQVKACKQYAANKGYRLKEIFVDNGKSGTTTNRPKFQEMIKKLENGEAKCVIGYRIDRITRNVADFSRIRKMFSKAKVDFHSVVEGDLNKSPSLIPIIFAAVAEWEVRKK